MNALKLGHHAGGNLVRDDLGEFSCQNVDCPDYQRKGKNNLAIDSWYGKLKKHRMLVCRTCRKRFSERKGTQLFGSQLSAETVARISAFLEEGKSIRETARLTGVNRNTVVRYSQLLGRASRGPSPN